MNENDEGKRLEEIQIGDKAEAAYKELESRFDIIEDGLYKKWRETYIPTERENIWHQLDGVRALRKSFTREIDTAKLARMQLDEQKI